jgi:hypothetical protein
MSNVICPGCNRSVEPLERVERDSKAKKAKTYKISYCPNTRCNFNIDLEIIDVKLWNNDKGFFEDFLP